ncbi:MAG: hypothetical protein GY913_35915 [Proteobacteria bacterium]|nr:hypothetical protein [Pseudomonadota bacterium]MCP4922318.1 hypothetical protein [Pseudomonadota bacterium]
MIGLLFGTAALAAPLVESETIVQVRHDFFGDPTVPAVSYLRLSTPGPVQMQAYAGYDTDLELDLFLLAASGRTNTTRWTLGRQLVTSPLRPWVLDGADLQWRGERLRAEAWAGVLRHHELDDLREGQPAARAQLAAGPSSHWAKVGVTLDTEPRADLEAFGRLDAVPGRPSVRALAIGAPDAPTEWLRVELGASPTRRVRATLHAQHREAITTDALLGEELTRVFAGTAVDEAGVGVRLSQADWSSVSASVALTRHDAGLGQAADMSWLPAPGGRVRLAPGYRYRSGAAGSFHALYGAATVAVTDATDVIGRAAIVPYQKLDAPWDTAVTGGLDVRQDWRLGSVQAGLLAASDATYRFDLRGTASLIVRWP